MDALLGWTRCGRRRREATKRKEETSAWTRLLASGRRGVAGSSGVLHYSPTLFCCYFHASQRLSRTSACAGPVRALSAQRKAGGGLPYSLASFTPLSRFLHSPTASSTSAHPTAPPSSPTRLHSRSSFSLSPRPQFPRHGQRFRSSSYLGGSRWHHRHVSLHNAMLATTACEMGTKYGARDTQQPNRRSLAGQPARSRVQGSLGRDRSRAVPCYCCGWICCTA